MEARKSAYAIGREKFRFVEHAVEDALELFAIHEGEKPAHATAERCVISMCSGRPSDCQ